jgi:glycosyltransferase involved in cell wall biosynthesis
MKIIVATTSFPYANIPGLSIAGKFVLEECLAYEAGGASVEVVVPDIPDCPRRECFEKNIKVHRFSYFFPRRWQTIKRKDGSAMYDKLNMNFYIQLPFFLFKFAWSIFYIAKGRNEPADIIHCNWSITALCALPAKYFLKIPVVLTTRGSDLRLIPKWINKFVFKHVDGVIDCFGPDYKKILDELPAKFIRLPVIVAEPQSIEGVNDNNFYTKDNFVIVMISRFDKTKHEKFGMAFFSLLEVLAELSQKYKLRCFFVGDGELRLELENRVSTLRLEKIVEFVGYQKNVFPYLSKADLVLGGVGLNAVSQEATLLGKVQLMPKIPLWYESIWFDKVNAILYNPSKTSSILEGIEFAILNHKKMEKISTMAIKTGEKYIITRKSGGLKYIKAFSEIIDEFQ